MNQSIVGIQTNAVAPVYPEKLLIYHAGTGRVVFLSFLKLTSIITCAFFLLVVVPGYYKSGKSYPEIAGGKPIASRRPCQ